MVIRPANSESREWPKIFFTRSELTTVSEFFTICLCAWEIWDSVNWPLLEARLGYSKDERELGE